MSKNLVVVSVVMIAVILVGLLTLGVDKVDKLGDGTIAVATAEVQAAKMQADAEYAMATAEALSAHAVFDTAVMGQELELLKTFLPSGQDCTTATTSNDQGLVTSWTQTCEPHVPTDEEVEVARLRLAGEPEATAVARAEAADADTLNLRNQILPVDRLLPETTGDDWQILLPKAEDAVGGRWGPNDDAPSDAPHVLTYSGGEDGDLEWQEIGVTGEVVVGDIRHIDHGPGIVIGDPDTDSPSVGLEVCSENLWLVGNASSDYTCRGIDHFASAIKTAYEGNGNTNAYTDSEKTKLAGIETGATGDQTAAEIKTAYESNSDTNAFTDSAQTKLAGIEASATADQTATEIKTAYESNSDTNVFTDAEKTKLAGIQSGAVDAHTASEIKALYESNPDTNAFTDAEKAKLGADLLTAVATDSTLTGDGSPASPLSVPAPATGGDSLEVATVRLDAAALVGLETARRQVIATPARGHYIVPHRMIIRKTGGPSSPPTVCGTNIWLAPVSSSGGLLTDDSNDYLYIGGHGRSNGDNLNRSTGGWFAGEYAVQVDPAYPGHSFSKPGGTSGLQTERHTSMWTGAPLTIAAYSQAANTDVSGCNLTSSGRSPLSDTRTSAARWAAATTGLTDINIQITVYYEIWDPANP